MNREERVNRIKDEILEDIKNGTLPRGVAGFSELHDYVDANGYGGYFDEEFEESDLPEIVAVQDIVDEWLKGMAAHPVPTATVGELIEALSAFPPGTYVLGYLADWYVNVSSDIDSTEHDEHPGEAAVVLNLTDNYDPRQW